MFAAFPLTELLIFSGPAFGLGVLVGFLFSRTTRRYSERPKEHNMDVASAIRDWYDKWAPAFVILIGVLAVTGVGIGTVATVTNAQQDRRADASTKALLRCFDAYAEAQSTGSKAVRVASVAKDEATAIFNRALNAEGKAFKAAVAKLITSSVTADDVQRLYDTLDARDEAGRALAAAQRDLDKARADNPVPEPPSKFCTVKP